MPEAPSLPQRRTVSGVAVVEGVGLFTGARATLRIGPAEAGHGIAFKRAEGGPEIPAHISGVQSPEGLPGRNTCLRGSAGGVWTVEHILSALTGLGITDALIKIDGPEAPIGDGSAFPFVEAVLSAGIRVLEEPVEPLVITRQICVRGRDAEIIATPATPGDAPGCLYRYELDYGPGAPIPAQSAQVEIAPGRSADAYTREVASARTFCTEAEARAMTASGLFKHLTAREMLVIGENGPIENALRFENEPARHKLLDLIGDLALTGRPIVGRITARRAGHLLNHEMARALLAAFGGY